MAEKFFPSDVLLSLFTLSHAVVSSAMRLGKVEDILIKGL